MAGHGCSAALNPSGSLGMRDRIRILVLGTGQMGSGIIRLVLQKAGLELVGAYGRRPERAGMDLGQAVGLGRLLGLSISTELDNVIERSNPDVAIQATCSRMDDAAPEITVLLRRGVRVISIAEEMAFPKRRFPVIAREIDRLAKANNAAVLGTGINPGFVLDLLVIALTGVCSEVRSITATRINDLSAFGRSVLERQGVGLTAEQFQRGVENGSVVGHIGFQQSIDMIAAALGWEIDRIEETRKPIVSRIARKTPFVTVAPGEAAGCFQTAIAYCAGLPVITLVHPQEIHPELANVETGDTIEILGTPPLKVCAKPEIPGGLGTISLAVNAIPRVLGAAPGLYSMADLPVPAAMMTDVRTLIRPANTWVAHG
jgi:4-hydroxy-tetrahydrodipicolinate reductase